MQLIRRRRVFSVALGSLAALGVLPDAIAGSPCRRCGCHVSGCQPICRLVCEERKITTTVWGMECEDLCIPGPSCPETRHSECLDPRKDDTAPVCALPRTIVWTLWKPASGPDIFTKRKLMKKSVTKTVPSFRWVVEDLCQGCTASLEPVKVPRAAEIPAPPQRSAKVLSYIRE